MCLAGVLIESVVHGELLDEAVFINHTDGVVVRVGCVKLFKFRNVFHAFDAGCIRYHGHDWANIR